ncbi:unnamed protein product (macronuclear) [Paramecium tetraurelia]|uniref:Uncharacterized protein n=1 Tax=Paramecium tetraurelia TaxID=5888 RepID=A0DAZ4_PARTE|nr:uncharacterized protein GSPATT00015118001 [Paramecium tetraurelia]CAK80211.1 unnamed protein product [Paramecium tetraurelia]|eukprot:XP_001447608.1 hypothetical protein (macronuclear) [Paramecium tetraurelia strain d4-2]
MNNQGEYKNINMFMRIVIMKHGLQKQQLSTKLNYCRRINNRNICKSKIGYAKVKYLNCTNADLTLQTWEKPFRLNIEVWQI